MEESPQGGEVCVVCALPEEVRAFLEMIKSYSERPLEEHISPRYGYSYRSATLKNKKDELLHLHISWLPRYGPQEMTLHLERVLSECQPRIVLMTGICAGDSRQVHLGDLVVAERTFTYDTGKFVLDEQGRSVHVHDTLTYQLDANILQFLGLFDDWKPLIASISHPPSAPEQREIACYLKAMASGSAVRADNPFEEVQVPVRGTVAIDMEGAAFGLVMSRYPLVRWLLIKGVCDYADQDKDDVYHEYAARASALYALSFIRAYVTHERLPRLDVPSSQEGSSGVWNVPYARNPHFTGRDDLLDQLHQRLAPTGQNDPILTRRVALTQPLAVKGLGGIGKTQVAVEYAYRCRDQGRYTHTLWVNAATEEALLASFVTIVQLLPAFAVKDETDQRKLIEAIKGWLAECEQPWLLIFDNVDKADDFPLLLEYLPRKGHGSVLLTTRANAVGSLAVSLEVEKMGLMEGVQLLLRRGQREGCASEEEINEATNVVIALDHFPLALDQAGAYIEETRCSVEDYLHLYQDHRQALLARRGLQGSNYPDSVATTWSLSFQKVEQSNPAAAELLRLCAYLFPDSIPEELIRDGAAQWSPVLQQAATDLFAFNQMMADLLKFSLLKRLTEAKAFSIHRLVQAVQMDRMEPEVQQQWAERVVRAVSEVFPDGTEPETWPQCRRYLPQAQTSVSLIERYRLLVPEAAVLLREIARYLKSCGLDAQAFPLLEQSLAIQQTLTLDERDRDVLISTLLDLGSVATARGGGEEATGYYRRALEMSENAFGLEHPSTVQCLCCLALYYGGGGDYQLQESLLKQALALQEKMLGPQHPEVANILEHLGLLYGYSACWIFSGKPRRSTAIASSGSMASTKIRSASSGST
jgi:nucleoside phosphorylase/tetratricopeptide (TPR) repeat protein